MTYAAEQQSPGRPTREDWWEIKESLAQAFGETRQAYFLALGKANEDLKPENVREATALLRQAAEALIRE